MENGPGARQTLLSESVLEDQQQQQVAVADAAAAGDDDDIEAGRGAKLTRDNKIYASDSNFVATDKSVRARLRRALSTHRFQVL